MFLPTILILLALPFSSAQLPYTVVSSVLSDVPTSKDVSYSCTFKNRWSKSRHSADYPTDARWAPPVMVSHNRQYSMWNSQSLASTGVKEVSEVRHKRYHLCLFALVRLMPLQSLTCAAQKGVSTTLVSEIRAASPATDVFVVGAPQIAVGSQVLPNIKVTLATTLLSSIARIAPSPDWFTGFRNFNAANSGAQRWLQSFTLETFPWDAGTEKGDTYNPSNDAESPPARITRFTTSNIRPTRVFVSTTPEGKSQILPVATWECKLV
jgi:Spondin_N